MARESIQSIYCWSIRVEGLTVYLGSTDHGACRIGLSLEKEGDCIVYFRKHYPQTHLVSDRERNRDLEKAVRDALLSKSGLHKDLALDIHGTPFQRNVWQAITHIPFSSTRTYGEVARMVGRPRAARAIGQALGKNPLPLLFPCHRVVGVQGLGGFTGGLMVKEYLLRWEKRIKYEGSK